MKCSKRILSIIIAMMIIAMSVLAVSAASYDTNTKSSFSVTCTKPGYTFTVYKVADLVSTTTPTYETKYDSLVSEISDEILTGDTSAVLSALDDVAEMPSTATVVGTYKSDDGNKATFNNLDHGIYYIKATNFPAGVKSVTNSVVSLPYYDGTTWQYSITDIELASKVTDDTVTTVKTITNSTKNNVNFTDVSLGDTVNFELRSTTAGSASMKLGSYVLYDDMSAGLTLDKDSFNVSLLTEDGSKIDDLSADDFTMTVTSEGENQNTLFNVALTKDFLQGEDFYKSDVYYTSVTYSAVLNEYAVVGTKGNPNTEVKLEFSNKNGVTDEVEGNTVYVYTYAVKTIKTDKATKLPLAGAEFALFKSEADALSYLDKTENNADNTVEPIGTGISDENGLVLYKNADGNELRLASGKYFAIETKAPKDYMVYGETIAIEVNVEYGETFVNGTWVTSAPEDGYGTADVANSKFFVPETGGKGTIIFFIVSTVCAGVAIAFVVIHVFRKKRETQATN